jgi:hypothetical protein
MAPIPDVTAAIDKVLNGLTRAAHPAHKSERVSH